MVLKVKELNEILCKGSEPGEEQGPSPQVAPKHGAHQCLESDQRSWQKNMRSSSQALTHRMVSRQLSIVICLCGA